MNSEFFLPYLSFAVLCLLFGTSYAVSTYGLAAYDGPVFTALRMQFAVVAGIILLIFRMLINRKYAGIAKKSILTYDTPIGYSMVAGIMNYGLPHSFISISQRSISSTTVTITQPLVSFFGLIFASIFLPDERFACSKLWPQLISIVGCVITIFPSFTQSSSNAVDYVFLLTALISFAYGSIFVKLYCNRAEPTLCVLFQLIGSAIYSTVFATIRCGAAKFSFSPNLIWPAILGIAYTFVSATLSLYTLRTLGAVKSNYANIGQIIVGVITGVVFLHEWDHYSIQSIVISCVGLLLLCFSIYLGLKSSTRTSKHDDEILPLLVE